MNQLDLVGLSEPKPAELEAFPTEANGSANSDQNLNKRQPKDVRALLPFNSEQTTLDDTTLEAIKAFLTNRDEMRAPLVEEEISTRSFKVSQYASERTRYRENLWEGSDLIYEQAIFDQVYKEEEDYALGNEFYKMVITESSHALACNLRGNRLGGILTRKQQLEPRTVKWLKKATGLQKPYDPLEQKPNNMGNDEDIGLLNKTSIQRRLTRGMVRSTRVKRQQERKKKENIGIESLFAAVREIESEKGVFQVPIRGDSRRGETKEVRRHVLVAKIPLSRKRDKFKLLTISRVIVNGKNFQTGEKFYGYRDWNLSRKRTIEEIDNESCSSVPSDEDDNDADFFPPHYLLDKMDSLAICHSAMRHFATRSPFPLRALDLRRRTVSGGNNLTNFLELVAETQRDETEVLGDMNLRSRLPSWDSIRAAHSNSVCYNGRHKFYRLVTCGSSYHCSTTANQWARHEFFYSDIDRPWYEEKDPAEDPTKSPVSSSEPSSRTKWRMKRRKVLRQRFSKRFIRDEQMRLFRFRSDIRKVRAGAMQFSQAGLPVMVYSERYHLIHRGVIMFYDNDRHGYLVKYDEMGDFGDLGCEFCHDTNIVVKGDVHYRGPKHKSLGQSVDDNIGVEPNLSTPSPVKCQSAFGKEDLVIDWLAKRPQRSSIIASSQCLEDPSVKTQGVEQIAERESLVGLVSALGYATQQKSAILDIVDLGRKEYCLGLDSQHSSWLFASLASLNKTIKDTENCIRKMYEQAYFTSTADNKREPSKDMESEVWKLCRKIGDSSCLPLSWTDILALDAGDVAQSLAICCREGSILEESPTVMPGLVSSAISYLCAVEYCCMSVLSENYPPSMNEMEVALEAELRDLLKPFANTLGKTSGAQLDTLSNETFQTIQELVDSTTIFKQELLAACATQFLKTTHLQAV